MFAVKCRTNLLLWLQKICRTRDWTLYFYSSEDHPFWDPFQNEIWILCLLMCPQLSHGVFLTCRILHTTWSSVWADVCRRLCWLVVLSRRWFRICDIWCKLPIQKMLWCVFKIRCVCVCVCCAVIMMESVCASPAPGAIPQPLLIQLVVGPRGGPKASGEVAGRTGAPPTGEDWFHQQGGS